MLTPKELTPVQRSLRARTGAHSLHASHDPRETTAKARDTFLSRFEKQVDPDGILDPDERKRRAKHARSAYFSALALKSSRARQAKRERASAKTKKPPVQAAEVEV